MSLHRYFDSYRIHALSCDMTLRFYHAYRGLAHSSNKTLYNILDLSSKATTREIKLQFKKLSKKFHPDLNIHLKEEDRETNNERYKEMVLAYETLKDDVKRREYDLKTGISGSSGMPGRDEEWANKRYGEVKHHLRGRSNSRLGYNVRRHRVHNFYDGEAGSSHFNGQHVNYGDRFGVPHFDYNTHLSKHLKFEQRLINKHLSDEDRQFILRQLAKDGDVSRFSEELVTKHMMHQVQRSNAGRSGPGTTFATNPHMYRGPQDGTASDEEGKTTTSTILMILGGSGLTYLFYQLFFG